MSSSRSPTMYDSQLSRAQSLYLRFKTYRFIIKVFHRDVAESVGIQWVCDGVRSIRHNNADSWTRHAGRQDAFAIRWLCSPVPVRVAPG